MDIKTIPTTELKDDLLETLADIVRCIRALSLGVTEYSGGSTQERLDTNEKIAANIRAELARRGES